jgi:tRNA pseudouridine38-40 synthase
MAMRASQSIKRNIKLILEYDGTNYHGWQSQAGSGMPTIQETLEKALTLLSKEEGKVFSSGRTDAGVHALGQVINFQTKTSIPAPAWAPALNRLLPADIRVLTSEEVSPEFHARYSARSKVYKYRILNRHAQTAIYRAYAWHINLPLNVSRMRRASSVLLGKHDFSSFRGSGCSAKSPIRTLKSVAIRKNGEFLELLFEADAFLQYMVRNITGTLVEVGLGRFNTNEIVKILRAKDRSMAGKTAPPHGLYLLSVTY